MSLPKGKPGIAKPIVIILVSLFVIVCVVLYGIRQPQHGAALPRYVEISEEQFQKMANSANPSRKGDSSGLSAQAVKKDSPPDMPAGSVILQNASDFEAVARIVPENEKASGKYFRIQPFASISIKGFPRGEYSVYYTTGRKWDEENRRFVELPTYSKTSLTIPMRNSWQSRVILYHPEDPERRNSERGEFAG